MNSKNLSLFVVFSFAFSACGGQDYEDKVSSISKAPTVEIRANPAGGNRFDTIATKPTNSGFFGYSGAYYSTSPNTYSYSVFTPDEPEDSDIRGASWGTNRQDLFAKADDELLHYYSTNGGSSWAYNYWGHPSGWTLVGSPSATSWTSNRLDVFTLARNNSTSSVELWHIAWTGSSLTSWENFGKPSGVTLTGGVAAVSWGTNRIDIFVRDTSNNVRHSWTTNGSNQGNWNNWGTPSGVTLSTDPVAVAIGVDNLHVFIAGTDNKIHHAFWTSPNFGWNDWGAPNDGGSIKTALGAVGYTSQSIIVAVNSQQALCNLTIPNNCNVSKILHRVWDGSTNTLSWRTSGTAAVTQDNYVPNGLTMTAW